MFSLLEELGDTTRHNFIFSAFTRTQNGLKDNLTKVQRFYNSYPTYLPNDHILIRLLYSAPTASLNADKRYIFDTVKDLIPQVSTSLNVTSSSHAGRMYNPGYFYGLGCNEMIMLHGEEFDLDTPWYELSPVEVYKHPFTDLSMQPLDGKRRNIDHFEDDVYSVVGINFPMLMVMMKDWVESDKSWMDEHIRYNNSHFLTMYVLPNMLGRHLELSVYNRLEYIKYREDIPEDNYKQSFHMVDYSELLNSNLQAWSNKVHNVQLSWGDYIGSLPFIFTLDAKSVFKLPDVFLTRMNKWVYIHARMDLVKELVQYDADTGNTRNIPVRRRVHRETRQLLRSRGYEGNMVKWKREDMLDELERLLVTLK